MELWIDAILIVIIALLIDRFVGELPNRFHILRWIGNAVDAIDRRIKIRDSGKTKVWGFLSYLLVFFIFWIVIMAICTAVRYGLSGYAFDVFGVNTDLGEIVWIIVTAFLFKMTFAIFSFRKHCIPIADDLRAGRTEDAAAKVQMIVSRNTKGMDAEHVASSCCETISENLVDSVISPTFYFGWLGLTGAIMFRCANLMDAMWGYINDRYGKLGFFVAKFDDVLGYVTSRISPVFVAIGAWFMRMNTKGIITAARNEHTKTPSPNSGWPMTAVAAAMGISMEKKDVYVMGNGPMPTVDDIARCYHLVELVSILFIVLITIPLFALIGIHVQVFFEDLLHRLFEAII